MEEYGQLGKTTFTVAMERHTKLPVQGSHILRMLLSVLYYARLGRLVACVVP